MNEKKYSFYVRDVGYAIKENALNAKIIRDNSTRDNLEYNTGYLMAYHEVVSLMKREALSFEIDISDICMQSIEPEKDLL